MERRLKEEIKSGIQTIQYQLITLMTCNGQAPFVTMFMYLDEVPDGQTRKDLAMIIEEVLRQRMQGVKNEKGVWITPAFPKLIYVLDEDNIHDDSPITTSPSWLRNALPREWYRTTFPPNHEEPEERRRIPLHGLPQLPHSRYRRPGTHGSISTTAVSTRA